MPHVFFLLNIRTATFCLYKRGQYYGKQSPVNSKGFWWGLCCSFFKGVCVVLECVFTF